MPTIEERMNQMERNMDTLAQTVERLANMVEKFEDRENKRVETIIAMQAGQETQTKLLNDIVGELAESRSCQNRFNENLVEFKQLTKQVETALGNIDRIDRNGTTLCQGHIGSTQDIKNTINKEIDKREEEVKGVYKALSAEKQRTNNLVIKVLLSAVAVAGSIIIAVFNHLLNK